MQSANSLHERLIEAALAAAEDGVWNKTTLSDLALRAKVHPHEARAAFNRVDDVLDAFARRIDEQLVAALDQSELAEASPRERLLEALMARIDLLASHRSALRALGEDAQRCPTAAVRTLVRMRTSMGNVLDLTGLAGNEWQRRTRAARPCLGLDKDLPTVAGRCRGSRHRFGFCFSGQGLDPDRVNGFGIFKKAETITRTNAWHAIRTRGSCASPHLQKWESSFSKTTVTGTRNQPRTRSRSGQGLHH